MKILPLLQTGSTLHLRIQPVLLLVLPRERITLILRRSSPLAWSPNPSPALRAFGFGLAVFPRVPCCRPHSPSIQFSSICFSYHLKHRSSHHLRPWTTDHICLFVDCFGLLQFLRLPRRHTFRERGCPWRSFRPWSPKMVSCPLLRLLLQHPFAPATSSGQNVPGPPSFGRKDAENSASSVPDPRCQCLPSSLWIYFLPMVHLVWALYCRW
mmetsp:Transcript_25291/g.73197  ORF Transcript_25291/g.73197 Transcript_25291/m.73197 type:complete len:211 (-) Transcript_25291:641-1273(-)